MRIGARWVLAGLERERKKQGCALLGFYAQAPDEGGGLLDQSAETPGDGGETIWASTCERTGMRGWDCDFGIVLEIQV